MKLCDELAKTPLRGPGMPSVLACPKCGSLLLVKVGAPSPLDGKRALSCLSCRMRLQPRRPKSLYYVLLVVMVLLAFVCAALAIRSVTNEDYGATVSFVVPLFIWIPAVLSLRRSLLSSVPAVFNTSEFPHPLVQLDAIKTVVSELDPAKDWSQPLGPFLAEVFRLADECLSSEGTAYTVRVKLEIGSAQRTAALSYQRGTPESAPNRLLDEISKLPAFPPPKQAVSIELSFRVRKATVPAKD